MRLTALKKSVHVLIMGLPGSGKGTVSSRIVRDFAVEHVSCGDSLRSEIANKTSYGKLAETYTRSGYLVPDDIVVPLIISQIQRIPISKHWLLDGFPRNVFQAKSLLEEERLDAVINLDVPLPVIQERLSGRWTHVASGRVYNDGFNPPRVAGIDDVTGEALVQRDDDKPETVRTRLETFEKQTVPLRQFFSERNLLHNYSGTSTDDIWPSIRQFFQAIASKRQRADC